MATEIFVRRSLRVEGDTITADLIFEDADGNLLNRLPFGITTPDSASLDEWRSTGPVSEWPPERVVSLP